MAEISPCSSGKLRKSRGKVSFRSNGQWSTCKNGWLCYCRRPSTWEDVVTKYWRHRLQSANFQQQIATRKTSRQEKQLVFSLVPTKYGSSWATSGSLPLTYLQLIQDDPGEVWLESRRFVSNCSEPNFPKKSSIKPACTAQIMVIWSKLERKNGGSG